MKRLLRKRNKGFTLIELMIVVAIIGILAAIAIPNFLRFQLKAKSSEGKVNIAAIRTAETAYNSEFSSYVQCAASPATVPPGVKVDFVVAGTAPNTFNTLGWAPEGQVYFQYQVCTGANRDYSIGALADIDNESNNQMWGYVHPNGGNSVACSGCAGVWDPVNSTASLHDIVGPCNSTSGQSVF